MHNEFNESVLKKYDCYYNVKHKYLYDITESEDVKIDFLQYHDYEFKNSLVDEASARAELSARIGAQDLHGAIVQPNQVDPVFHILVHIDRYRDKTFAIQTLAHEYTHVIDYSEVSPAFPLNNMRTGKIHDNDTEDRIFKFCSETRASYRSNRLYIHYLEGVVADKSLVSDTRAEVHALLPYIESSIQRRDIQEDYCFAHTFGRYIACLDLCKSTIDPSCCVRNNEMCNLMNQAVKIDYIQFDGFFKRFCSEYNRFYGV